MCGQNHYRVWIIKSSSFAGFMWEKGICMSFLARVACYVVSLEGLTEDLISENVWQTFFSSLNVWYKLGVSRLLVEKEKRIALTACCIHSIIWHICTDEMMMKPKKKCICFISPVSSPKISHIPLWKYYTHTPRYWCQRLINSVMLLVTVCVA